MVLNTINHSTTLYSKDSSVSWGLYYVSTSFAVRNQIFTATNNKSFGFLSSLEGGGWVLAYLVPTSRVRGLECVVYLLLVLVM